MKTGAVILAGGKSRRMGGICKADLVIGDRSIFERIRQELDFFDEIIISSNDTEKYEKYGRVMTDIYNNCGPAGGIYTALENCEADALFVTACDMPFIRSETIKGLFGLLGDCDGTAVKNGERIEPLFAVYRKNTAGHFRDCIESGIYSMNRILDGLNMKYVSAAESGAEAHEFTNINTPEDYERITEAEYENKP